MNKGRSGALVAAVALIHGSAGVAGVPAAGNPTVAPPPLIATAPAQAVAPAESAPASLPSAPAGTQLSLMIIDEVSTKTAKPGDRFPLRLDRPVIIDGRVVIAEGAAAVGEVIAASESGIAGKAGKLATRLLHLTVAGRQLPISGDPRSAGQNGALAVVLASLALTPWGLFARGNNAKLKAGDIVVGVLVEPYTPVALPLTTTARTGPVVNP